MATDGKDDNPLTAETIASTDVFLTSDELGVQFPADDDDAVVLNLAELVPDASGEVVFVGDDELAFQIVTEVPLTESGIAESHVTATGVDVTGLHFYSFEGGITLYSAGDLVIVDNAANQS